MGTKSAGRILRELRRLRKEFTDSPLAEFHLRKGGPIDRIDRMLADLKKVIAFLPALLLFLGCQNQPKDDNRLFTVCLRGHYVDDIEPVGQHDIVERRFVCDDVLPLVRWEHVNYRLGEVYVAEAAKISGELSGPPR